MIEIKQSTATHALVFRMVDSTDHVSGKTGLTPAVTLSKNGGAFASPSGAVSEISGGFYMVAPNATDSNSLGILALRATATGADPAAMAFAIVANIESDTFTRLAATPPTADQIATQVESHLLNEGDSQMLINAIVGAIGNQNVDEAALIAAIRSDLERSGGNLETLITRLTATRAGNLDNLDNLDAAVSSRSSHAAPVAPDNAGIAAIKAKTDEASQIFLRAETIVPETPVVILPDPVDDPDLCVVYYDSEQGNGVPKAGVKVVFRLVGILPQYTASGKFVENTSIEAVTDPDGRVTVSLEKGLKWRADSRTLFGRNGFDFTVPDAETVNLNTYTP